MKLQEIKDAVDAGIPVYWKNRGYEVKHKSDYFIYHIGGSLIGLTWADGVTMNGEETDFFCD